MNNGFVIRTNGKKQYSNIKIEYHNTLDSGRIVSQTFPDASGKPPTQVHRIISHVGTSFPQIAIKQEEDQTREIVLVNGCWDTSNKIPNIVAEMHSVKAEELQVYQHQGGAFFRKSDGFLSDSRDFVSASPMGSDSGIESDCTEGNLSWLLNYKIHELPPVPDTSAPENFITSEPSAARKITQVEHHQNILQRISEGKDPLEKKPCSGRLTGLKKPPFTYTELIEHALSEKGELTVSGIYQWISDHFPFYKPNDDRWKNSVRHNLSINPHFRKGGKAVHGAGHLWTIAQKDEKKTWQIKQRMQQFMQNNRNSVTTEQDAFDKELQAATESILGEIQGHGNQVENSSQEQTQPIEVEFINLAEGPNGLEDFLSPPVSKQEIVNECGLGADFFITDINPNTLGLGTATDDRIYEDMSFEYYEMQKE